MKRISSAAREEASLQRTVNMDRASQVLRTYATISERDDVPLTTLYHYAHERPSKEEKA